MENLPLEERKIKEVLASLGVHTGIVREWGSSHLAVRLPVNRHTVAARFHFVNGPIHIYTLYAHHTLPPNRYICIRIPYFYQWWDDLSRFPEIVDTANNLVRNRFHREAFPDFYVSFTDGDTLCFRMDVPLKEGETLESAVRDIWERLLPALKVAVSHLARCSTMGERRI